MPTKIFFLELTPEDMEVSRKVELLHIDNQKIIIKNLQRLHI